MLVISRKADMTGGIGSTFQIGDSKVVLLEVRGNKARFGIVADANVPIVRDDMKDQNPKPRSQGCRRESSET